MSDRDPVIKGAFDQAQRWLYLFPLIRPEERSALIAWLHASPLHMRKLLLLQVEEDATEELCESVAAKMKLDDSECGAIVRDARVELARQKATGYLEEGEIDERDVAWVYRQELIEDVGEWFEVLNDFSQAESRKLSSWLGTSTDRRAILAWARQAWARVPDRCKGPQTPEHVKRRHYHRALRSLRAESVRNFLTCCADAYPGGLGALDEAVEAEIIRGVPR